LSDPCADQEWKTQLRSLSETEAFVAAFVAGMLVMVGLSFEAVGTPM
jgi:hypothetical protein